MPRTLSNLTSTARHFFAPSDAKAKTPTQAKPGQSHGLSGLLGGLRARAKHGGNKVHPEPPTSMAPRADLQHTLGRQEAPPQPSSQNRAASQEGSHRRAQLPTQRPAQPNVLAERNPTAGTPPPVRPAPSFAPQATQLPMPSALLRPAAGTENANPNIRRPSQHAMVKKNLPSFAESFKSGRMDRTFEPKQLVKAMVDLSKGTKWEEYVNQEAAQSPKWGPQMQQRWNTLRNSVADARDDGNAQVPSLEYMIDRRPAAFIRFMAVGDEESFARLMRPERQAAPAQTPAVPEVITQAHSTRPQGREDMRPQAPRTEHAVQRPGRNESKPADERTQLTAALGNLDQQIEASKLKGEQILRRIFDPATIGPAVAAASRESYAHKAQHDELIAARSQVQAQLQHVGTNAAAGQLIGQIKDVDGKIAKLEQRAGQLNQVMERSPQGSERWVAARREKNSLRPAWKELTSQRAGMQAELEGLRPEFQQARELAKGLAELAKVHGGEMRQSRDGSRIYLDRSSIENHYDRFDQSRHLLNKRDDLENAQQQLNKLINSGMLEGIAPNERRELKQLATLDIGQQFRELNDLKGTVAEIRGALKSMGAGGLYEGIRTTPEQRAHDAAEERRNAQEALDNGY